MAVSSALAGLTSLFGMGRGGPCRNSHPKIFNEFGVLSIESEVFTLFNFTLFNFKHQMTTGRKFNKISLLKKRILFQIRKFTGN